MAHQRKKLKGKAAESISMEKTQTPGGQNLYNYVCLSVVLAFIAVGFLPDEAQKYFEDVFWNLPVIVAGSSLVGLFFIFNRKTVASIVSAPLFPARQPGASIDGHGAFFDKTGAGFSALVVGILIISGFMIFSYRLDNADFQEDEYLVVSAAEGYRQSGTFVKWDFIQDELSKDSYARAWPHTWLVAQSYRIFGVSEWSSRIVSVLCGCFFAGVSFFVLRYFFADTIFACLMSSVFLLNPDYIYYWRLTRMYALLLPAFLILAFAVFKALEGRRYAGEVQPAGGGIRAYMDLDYFFIAISLALLYLNYNIHVNSLIIGISTCIFILLIALLHREKKYVFLTLLILLVIPLMYFLLTSSIFSHLLYNKQFFQGFNLLYIRLMAARPFYPIANIALLISFFLIIPMASSGFLRKKLLFISLVSVTTLVFFVFVVDFYGKHYRYISHATPFAIIMICFSYVTMLKVFKSKPVLIIGLLFLLAAQAGNLIRMADILYHDIPGQPRQSQAYEVVKKNIKDGEAIFAQNLRGYYMQGIPKNTPIISLGNIVNDAPGTNPYTFDKFFKDLQAYKKGWVIWEKPKERRIDPKVAAYVTTLFQKVAGEEKDNLNVEIYFFNAPMIRLPDFR